MSYTFSGKRAIITGASSGIGEGIAKKFGDLGVKVSLTARRESQLNGIAEEIKKKGGTAIVTRGDATRKEDIANVVEKTVDKFGGIDMMVNCSGIGGPVYFEDISEARIREHMEVNYFAAVEYCKRVIPLMKKEEEGYIVNIGSVSSLIGFPTYVSYSASKAALLRFSDSLRHEVKKYGIKVSVFCPSLVNTAMVTDHWEDHADWVSRFKILEVDPVVNYLIKGMQKERFIILDAPDVKLMYAMYRYFPRTFTRIFTWFYKMQG